MLQRENYRDFPKSLAGWLIAFCAMAFASLSQMAIYMGFAPGWSNGWPGLSQQTVFAAFMSAAFFAIWMSGGIAMAAFPCSLLQQRVNRNYTGWLALMFVLLLLMTVGGYITGWLVYPNVRTWVK